MRRRVVALIALLLVSAVWVSSSSAAPPRGATSRGPNIQVRLSRDLGTGDLTGRVFVIASTIPGDSQLSRMNSPTSPQPFFGQDVSGWRPGTTKDFRSGAVYGYPIEDLADLPPGDYHLQAFMDVYTRFTRSDGSQVWLHMPCGDGQRPTSSPGNLYSSVVQARLDGRTARPLTLELDTMIPYPAGTTPFPENAPDETCQQGDFADTEHVKHIKIQSELLSEFWGKPMYIGANVLLPEGYDDDPEARYPVVYNHGHWPGGGVFGFNENLTNAFSQWWVAPDTPRFIAVTIRHENPYYDDSYAVNSANLGPYGDAITQELIPAIDAQFRTIPERWARTLNGGSTGGWEALAQMIFYPDVYGGTWPTCPDPVDFRSHQLVNVYSDSNAYVTDRQWVDTPRPSSRNVAGNTTLTMQEENLWELALGTSWRSTKQWAVWAAVYGPQGPDGYPADIWDQRTGEIDHDVAEAWRAMDLRQHVVDNWDTLGDELSGRIHIFTGEDDTYFLENAVQLFEEATDELTDPPADFEIVYGERQPHCWSPYTTPQLLEIMYDAMMADRPE